MPDQGRKHRMELEAASNELAKANRDLQDSFEWVKGGPLASIDGGANLIESAKTSDEVRKSSPAEALNHDQIP